MILNMTGGAGGSGKSEIIVYAPAGSTVTVQRGTETPKTATEKSGVWTFKNCDVGTWVVNASLGNKEWSGEVVIQEEGQLMRYEVTASYFTAPLTVKFHAGYTVTVKKGNREFTSGTSGEATFTLDESGIWEVIHNVGSESFTKTMDAVIDGEPLSVDMRDIYYNGVEVIAITGGWVNKYPSSSYGAGTISKGPESITITCTNKKSAVSVTANSINTRTFSKLSVFIKSASGFSGSRGATIRIYSDSDAKTEVARATISGSNAYTELDLSTISGDYWIGITAYSGDSGTIQIEFSEVNLS